MTARGPDKWKLLAAVAALGLAFDQWTKFLAVERLTSAFARVGAHTLAERVEAFFRLRYLEPLATAPYYVFHPFWRMSYATDGGELGRAGPAAAVAVAAVFAGVAGTAYAVQPPTVHLSAGVHQGPLVITRREVLVGAPGAVVRGGIVVKANGVTIRNVAVVGGENGITIDGYRDTMLDGVSVTGAELDGIHVRGGGVMIRNCRIDMLGNAMGQGIDISYNTDMGMSMVEGCTIVGGMDGITTHSSMTDIVHNHVSRTTSHAIAVTEMSMGSVARNNVTDAVGAGIYCGDHSMCEIEHNVVQGTRADTASGDETKLGYAIVTWWDSDATVHKNTLVANPRTLGAFASARFIRKR